MAMACLNRTALSADLFLMGFGGIGKDLQARAGAAAPRRWYGVAPSSFKHDR